jgi:hypothetical protein
MTGDRGQPDAPPGSGGSGGGSDITSDAPPFAALDRAPDPPRPLSLADAIAARRATDLGRRVSPPGSTEQPPSPEPSPPAPEDPVGVAADDPVGVDADDPAGVDADDPVGAAEPDETGAEPHQPPDAGPPRRLASDSSSRHPFGRRRILPAAIAVAIAAGVIVAVLGSPAGQRPVAPVLSPGPTEGSAGYLTTVAELRRRAGDAARGIAPFSDAVVDLMSWASTAVRRSPHPVQPLVVVGNDNVLVDDATRAYGLGLAYAASGDERYAVAAAATVRAWSHEVRWADDVCTDDGGCHTTLSISRAAPGFVFAAAMIADSTAWTADDATSFRSWLRTVILPAASERPNNWGDAGTFMRVVVADYLGDRSAFDAAIAKWRSLLNLIEADGRIPEEARRGTAGISYTQEALQYKLAVARIAELRGIDLWDAVGAQGATLKVALERLAYFSAHPDEWPDAVDPEVPPPGRAWEIAYAHWPEAAFVPFVQAVRPFGDRGHSAIRWTTLTNGIPIDPVTAAASPSPTPSGPTPSLTPAASVPPPAPSDPPQVASLTGLKARLVDTAASGDVRVRVSWSAPRGTDRVRIEWSTGGSWHRLAVDDGRTGTAVDARPAGTVSYRGRVTDGGRDGPWTELRAVVSERIDARPSTLALHGAWSMAGGSYSGGSALSTNQAGATATWQGRASDLLIIGPVGPTRGRLEVIVDGRLEKSVSLNAGTYAARRLLASLHWSGTGEHRVVLRAEGAGGRTVAIDELVRLDSGTLSSPASRL